MRNLYALLASSIVANAVVLLAALYYLPPEKTLGHLYKIVYVHVPPAWTAYVAFTVALMSSIMYVRRGFSRYDLLSYSSILLGVFLTGLAILLGSILSSKAWGTYWEWREPRMTSTLILFLTYLGYLVLRASIEDIEKKRAVSAAYAIMAFVTIPLSYASARIFRSLHPLPELTFEMRLMLLAAFFTHLAIFYALLRILHARLIEMEKVWMVE